MRISVITIFPGYLDPLRESLLGKAIADGVIELTVHDLRDWTTDRHRTVDDAPYGGGPGMVMKPDVWGRALDAVCGGPATTGRPTLIVPTPVRRHRPAGDHRCGHPGAGPRTVHR
jgi:tRNA (guanine37-N1)-methyltransferase